MKEEWKPYPGWEDYYEVSNKSRIRNVQKGNILKPHLHHSNYYGFCFSRNGENKYLRRSRIVALVWISNPDNKKEVNHKNGITTDDSIENLEWIHPSDNILHYYYKLDKGSKRKINVFSMEGELINQYPSISMAVREMKLPKSSHGNIVTCLKGRIHYAYNHKWQYA
jgi:hypothetical protein